ncbi:MAG TPA: LemA family protein [Clostridiales bacterium]|nr:LemA family protein [Clostridiales bacterium]
MTTFCKPVATGAAIRPARMVEKILYYFCVAGEMELIMDILLYVIGGIILVVLLWYISTRNSIARAEVKIDEAESGIDVALTKRYDVLTKMLDITKGYAKHEVETLTKVVNLRRGMTMGERNQENSKMDEMLGKINVLVENYPDLKASENFKQLQMAVMDVEEHLQASRRAYNGNVTIFNNIIVSFPSSIVAGMMGKSKREFFEAEATKRSDVKMEF